MIGDRIRGMSSLELHGANQKIMSRKLIMIQPLLIKACITPFKRMKIR